MMIMVLLMYKYVSLMVSSVGCEVGFTSLVLQSVISPVRLFPYSVTEVHLSIFHTLFMVEPFWNISPYYWEVVKSVIMYSLPAVDRPN
jgi:hypothetical protein